MMRKNPAPLLALQEEVDKDSIVIEISNITKSYIIGPHKVNALNGINLKIEAGDFIAIMGPSGSGKSTLAQILGMLDIPSTGSYKFLNKEVSTFSDDDLSIIRRDQIGFIFQQFNLIAKLDAKENIELPLLYSKNDASKANSKQLLESVGLSSRADHHPNQLSGGQQQRVAIARALINKPKIIFADEPTGNLDSQSEVEIMKILSTLNEQGITIIMVTHEDSIAQQAKRVIRMRDGVIVSDDRLKPINNTNTIINETLPKISSTYLQEIWVYLKESIKTIAANKIRSGLSMLGILIGVASVISILAIGKGASMAIESQISSMGSNLLILRPGSRRTQGVSSSTAYSSKITSEDVILLKEKIPSIKNIGAVVEGNVQISFGNNNKAISISGVEPIYPEIRNWTVSLGRFFNDEENKSKARVCLIGSTIYKDFFKGANPIGETIKINKINFQVIGVMDSKSGAGWRDPNETILIPIQTAMKRVLGKDSFDELEIEILEVGLVAQAEEDILSSIISSKNIPLSQRENAFRMINMADIQKTITESQNTMALLLTTVAAISLLVGGIGIMNIMLVSVTERTKEIGLRKAIGATSNNIRLQFLSESAVMSAAGGILGIILGVLITFVMSQFSGWTTYVTVSSVILSFVFSSFIGIVFGFYPAYKASLLHPIQALRYE